MIHTLPPLTYSYDALEPFIDAQTMEIHHTKHHQAYIDKLNAAIKPYDHINHLKADQLIQHLNELPEAIRTAVRNHGGGHANHTFFWPLLKKGIHLKGPVAEAIDTSFGGFDAFKKDFSNAATMVFGSGWAWVVSNRGKLEIMTTANQDSPLNQGKHPILK